MEAVFRLAAQQLRARWRGWAAFAVLAAVAGGAVLAAAAGASRTETAYPRFLVASRASDVLVAPLNSSDACVATAGALPGPDARGEIAVTQIAAEQLNLHVGSVLRMVALDNSPHPRPRPFTEHVVGVFVTRGSVVPVTYQDLAAQIMASPALYRELGASYEGFNGTYVTLKPGTSLAAFSAEAQRLAARYRNTGGQVLVADEASQPAAIVVLLLTRVAVTAWRQAGARPGAPVTAATGARFALDPGPGSGGRPSVPVPSTMLGLAVTIAATVIPAIGLAPGTGPVTSSTVLAGRPPATGGEIALGSTVLRQLGLRIGQTVKVGTPVGPRLMRITGSAVFPFFGQGSFTPTDAGQGAETTAAVLEPLAAATSGGGYNFALVSFAPGPDKQAEIAAFQRAWQPFCANIQQSTCLITDQRPRRPAVGGATMPC